MFVDLAFGVITGGTAVFALLFPQPSKSPAIQRMLERMSKWQSREALYHGLTYKPREDDVYVVTSPKCGTTWVQMIMHQLRSKGQDDSFDEISQVVPYDECCLDLGLNLNDKQPYEPPRCFKSHFFFEACPKGAKYILIHRDPQQVGPSFYHFFNGWFFEQNSIDINIFVSEFWLGRGAPTSMESVASFWHFLISWWPHRNDSNILWLFYEDLEENLPACVRHIAHFMGLSQYLRDDPGLLDIVLHRSSLSYMQQHSNQFDEHPAKIILNEKMGMPKDAGMSSTKVKSPTQHRPSVSPAIRNAIDNRWKEVVAPLTGYPTYHHMRT